MNDKTLRQDVIAELDFDPSLDSTDIGVAIDNGVVTLTGHVPSYAHKVAAERAAWRVKGVRAIAQEIQVRLPDDKKDHDDEIAQRALQVLKWDAFVPEDALHVKVQGGLVSLTGQVKWHYQRIEAELAVRKLSGVTGVINHISLLPTAIAQPAEVKKHISDALKRHAEFEAERIRVKVHDGGVVSLDGEVENRDERNAVERAVWSTPGVRAVHDHITIG